MSIKMCKAKSNTKQYLDQTVKMIIPYRCLDMRAHMGTYLSS